MIKIRELTFEMLAEITGGRLVGKNGLFNVISISSKEKTGGSGCFFAIKGQNFDGNDYVDEAIANGNTLIVSNVNNRYPVSVILVDDVIKALGKLAKFYKGNTKIIAVTGSVGKTTTKEMILSVLGQKYSVCGTIGNHNNEIGVPLTLLSIKDEDFCVVEMGMRQLGEIEWLSYISEPYCSIITNVGLSHIERLGSKKNILKAKLEILTHTKEYAVLPYEKDFIGIELNNIKPTFIGNGGDYSIEQLTDTSEGIKIKIATKDKCSREIFLKTFSHANANNALIAYSVGKIFEIEDKEIFKGLQEYRDSGLRGEIKAINRIEFICDCYNSSLEAMYNGLNTLVSYAGKENKSSIAVLGDMLELGPYSFDSHFKVGERARKMGVNFLLTYGKYARAYIDGFRGGIEFSSLEAMGEYIKNHFKEGSVALLKASRAVKLEKILEIMKE